MNVEKNSIQVLSPEVVDQIAAGEVVERPAHMVKELVENSIDSSATEVRIQFEKGGRRVQVSDNGCGIPKHELGLALSRHATSKISTSDQLWSLNSFGFRGEALASIASVSRVLLRSRPHTIPPQTPTSEVPTSGTAASGTPTSGTATSDTPTNGTPTSGAPTSGAPTSGAPINKKSTSGVPTSGAATNKNSTQSTYVSDNDVQQTAWELDAHFGKPQPLRPVGGEPGTRIVIDDLFANTPARLKFLKTDTAESVQIKDVLKALALSHPEVSFYVKLNKELIFCWPRASFLERAQQVLEVDELFEHRYTYEDVKAHALIAPPNKTARTRKSMWCFVQNRFVQDKNMQAAVMDAYRSLLMHREYPIGVFFLNLPAGEVDVNIHPTKSQVKFRSTQNVFRALNRCVREKLEQAPWLENLLCPQSTATPAAHARADSNTRVGANARAGANARLGSNTGFSVGADRPSSSEALLKTNKGVENSHKGAGRSQTSFEQTRSEPTRPDWSQSTAWGQVQKNQATDLSPVGAVSAAQQLCVDHKVSTDASAIGAANSMDSIPSSGGANPATRMATDVSKKIINYAENIVPRQNTVPPNGAQQNTVPLNGAQQNIAPQSAAQMDPTNPNLTSSDAATKASGLKPVADPFRQEEAHTAQWGQLKALAQLQRTYIVTQTSKAMLLIDQHAAAERVLFERLWHLWKDKKIPTQYNMIGPNFKMSADKIEALLKHKQTLEQMGFIVEAAGPELLALTGTPAGVSDAVLPQVLESLASDMLKYGTSFAFEKVISDTLATMACHSAVRAGQELNLSEMQSLLTQMDEHPLSSFCPHGRPVFVEIPFSKLERDFGRRV